MTFLRYPEWMPDQGLLENPGLITARNVIPDQLVYRPLPSLELLGVGPLDARFRGGIPALDATGLSQNYVGDATKLYHYSTLGAEDISKGGGYSLQETDSWEFVQFGTKVIAACNTATPIQAVTVGGSPFGDLSASPDAPNPRHLGVVRAFVVAGNTEDAEDALQWCAANDPTDWPAPGSDDARSKLSDRRFLAGSGGAIQRVVGAGEWGAVFQRRAIWRMDFVGGDLIFDLNPVDTRRGAFMPGGVVVVGGVVFYWSEDGFFLLNGSQSVPIGARKIDRFVESDLAVDHLHRVTASFDPQRKIVVWSYPGLGHTNGTPNRLLIYNWVESRWSLGVFEHEGIVQVAEAGDSMDTLNFDMDTPGDVNMDGASATQAASVLGGFTTGHEIARLSGTPPEAVLQFGDRQLLENRRAFVSEVRPVVEGGEVRVQVGIRDHARATMVFPPGGAPNGIGVVNLRAGGRYHRLSTLIAAGGFDFAEGLDLVVLDEGGR